MAVTHPTDVRNDIANLVVDKIDVSGPGSIVFQDGSVNDSAVATLTFSATAFGAATGGIATAAAIKGDSDCNAGTVSKFTVFDGAGDSCFNGTVTATGGGGDIVLSSTAIGKGDTITISSLTYEAPN